MIETEILYSDVEVVLNGPFLGLERNATEVWLPKACCRNFTVKTLKKDHLDFITKRVLGLSLCCKEVVKHNFARVTRAGNL